MVKHFNYGLQEALQKGEVKIGDKVRIPNSSSCWNNGVGFWEITEYSDTSLIISKNGIGRKGKLSLCTCGDRNLPFELEVNHLTNLTNIINIMTTIKEFAKKLILSKEEKLLRKHGLKNDCGDYTQDAKDLVINRLTTDNEKYLLEIAEKKEAEETKK